MSFELHSIPRFGEKSHWSQPSALMAAKVFRVQNSRLSHSVGYDLVGWILNSMSMFCTESAVTFARELSHGQSCRD